MSDYGTPYFVDDSSSVSLKSAEMNRAERLRWRRQLYRLRRDCEMAEQRDERLRRQREYSRRRCAQLTEQQRQEILQLKDKTNALLDRDP